MRVKDLLNIIEELRKEGIDDDTEVCVLDSESYIVEIDEINYDETDIPTIFLETN